MTALIVIGAIALFIFILLSSSIRVDLEYDTVFKFRVKYLFFTFVKNPLSPKELQKKKKKELRKKKKQEKKKDAHPDKTDTQAKKAKAEQTETDKKGQSKEAAPKNPKMKFSLDLILRIIGRASPHVKRIFKKIRLNNVLIDITAGGDDAAKIAISYGVYCSIVHSLATILDSLISFKADKISVKADFDLPKTDCRLRGTLKFRVSTLLHSGIWGFFAVLSEIRKDSVAAAKAETGEKKAA